MSECWRRTGHRTLEPAPTLRVSSFISQNWNCFSMSRGWAGLGWARSSFKTPIIHNGWTLCQHRNHRLLCCCGLLIWCNTMCICRNESLRDNINAAKTLVIILIVFFVCWFPFFLTYTLSFVGKVRKWEALGLFTFIEAHTFTMREQKGQTVIVHHASQSVCWQQQQPRH